MFHSPDGLTNREKYEANTRRFLGDGTPYLKVPGLVKPEQVRVGGTVLPAEMLVETPTDNTLTRLRAERAPGFVVLPDDNGTPVLYRNQLSNDGIWQAGAPVFVTGQWAAESAAGSRGAR